MVDGKDWAGLVREVARAHSFVAKPHSSDGRPIRFAGCSCGAIYSWPVRRQSHRLHVELMVQVVAGDIRPPHEIGRG